MTKEELYQALYKIEVQELIDFILPLLNAIKGVEVTDSMLRVYSSYVEGGDVWERVETGSSLDFLKAMLTKPEPDPFFISYEIAKMMGEEPKCISTYKMVSMVTLWKPWTWRRKPTKQYSLVMEAS